MRKLKKSNNNNGKINLNLKCMYVYLYFNILNIIFVTTNFALTKNFCRPSVR